MSYKETEKTIKNFENEYGEFVVRSAFIYMIDVGKENFNDATVCEIKENIKAECREIEARGNVPLATAKFQCEIVDVAYELSKLPTMELLVYVQKNLWKVMEKILMHRKIWKQLLTLFHNKCQNILESQSVFYIRILRKKWKANQSITSQML